MANKKLSEENNQIAQTVGEKRDKRFEKSIALIGFNKLTDRNFKKEMEIKKYRFLHSISTTRQGNILDPKTELNHQSRSNKKKNEERKKN